MKEITILLNDFSKIKKFTNEVSKISSDVDLVRGRYVIDAKSTMGIFTLDLSKPISVVLNSDDETEILQFTNLMEEFAYEDEN